MPHSSSSRGIEDEVASSPLDVRRSLAEPIDLARISRACDDLFGLPATGDALRGSDSRDIEMDMGFGLGPTPVTIRKAAIVELGPASVAADGRVAVDVSWRASTFAPLFPVFAGRLVIDRDSLSLHGRYAPPFGRFGLVIDRALLHLVAAGTGTAFLERIEQDLRNVR